VRFTRFLLKEKWKRAALFDIFCLYLRIWYFVVRLNYEYIYKLHRIFCLQASNYRTFWRDEFLTSGREDKYLRDTINRDMSNQSVKTLNYQGLIMQITFYNICKTVSSYTECGLSVVSIWERSRIQIQNAPLYCFLLTLPIISFECLTKVIF